MINVVTLTGEILIPKSLILQINIKNIFSENKCIMYIYDL